MIVLGREIGAGTWLVARVEIGDPLPEFAMEPRPASRPRATKVRFVGGDELYVIIPRGRVVMHCGAPVKLRRNAMVKIKEKDIRRLVGPFPGKQLAI